MKELRNKTILTIFSILTAILITGLTILNINSYRREYMSIERGLNVFDNRGGFKDGPPGPNAAGSGENMADHPAGAFVLRAFLRRIPFHDREMGHENTGT